MDSKSYKTAIHLLNDGVNQFIAEFSTDYRLANIVDLSILTYGECGVVYQDFAPISKIEPINLIANHSSAYIADTIDMAIENTRNRIKLYCGGTYKPWIIFITDGEFHDSHDNFMSVTNKVQKREQENKLRFFCLGIGNNFDPTPFKTLTNNVFVLNKYKFPEFFVWLKRAFIELHCYAQATVAPTPLPSNDDPNEPGQKIFYPV